MQIKPYVLAIGELLVDAISNEFVSNLSEAKTFNLYAGGSPANFCRFLLKHEVPCELIASVGNDGLGKFLLNSLTGSGVSIKNINQLNSNATSVMFIGRSKGTPDFISYRDADKHLHEVIETVLKSAAIVHTTAFALSVEPAQSVIMKTCAAAHKFKIPVSIDWNYAEEIWGGTNNSKEVFTQIQTIEPLLKFSLDDVMRFNKSCKNIGDAKQFLQAVNASVICLTCGAEGIWYKTKNLDWQHSLAKPVNVKDATGAGDAYWAGFISGWYKKLNIDDCVKIGIETAALRLTGEI